MAQQPHPISSVWLSQCNLNRYDMLLLCSKYNLIHWFSQEKYLLTFGLSLFIVHPIQHRALLILHEYTDIKADHTALIKFIIINWHFSICLYAINFRVIICKIHMSESTSTVTDTSNRWGLIWTCKFSSADFYKFLIVLVGRIYIKTVNVTCFPQCLVSIFSPFYTIVFVLAGQVRESMLWSV